MKKALIINGPNLNMLGTREPEVYGSSTLDEIIEYTENKIRGKALLTWFQSNDETKLIERIHSACNENFDFIIINPGAFGHTSIALFDALSCLKIPLLEVHLSNTYKRESFRWRKLTARAGKIIMEGLGRDAYWLAIHSQTF